MILCVLAATFGGSRLALAQSDPAVYAGAVNRMVQGYSYFVPVTIVNNAPSGVASVVVTITNSANVSALSATNPAGSVSVSPNSVTLTIPFLNGYQIVETEFHCQSIALGGAWIDVFIAPGGTNAANDNSTARFQIVRPSENFTDGAQVSTDDPISSFGGNFFVPEPPDLFLRGPLPLFVQRRYDSALFTDGIVRSALGANWQLNYDLALAVNGTNASLTFLKGRLIQFQRTNVTQWALVANDRARADIGFALVDRPSETVLTDPRSQLAYCFDPAGHLARIEDGRGNTNQFTYTGDLLTSVADGLGGVLTFSYNAEGRLTNVTDGLRSVGYGHTGTNLTSFTDTLGNTTTYTYDPTNTANPGLMTARTRPEGNTPVTQIYDAAGRVISQTDAVSATTTISHTNTSDPATGPRRETTITDPLGFATRHSYDDGGDLAQISDETGKTNELRSFLGRRYFVRDRLGNLTTMGFDNASGLPVNVQSPGIGMETYTYGLRTNNGLVFRDLRQVNHPDASIDRYGYDALGNLIRHTNRASHILTNAYNTRGQLLTSANPLGGVIAFAYDASANLASAEDSDVSPTTFEYDGLRHLTNIVNPDATTRRFAYDALDRLLSATDERGHTTTAEFDANGRLTKITDRAGGSARYEYDALDRLVRTIDRLGKTNSVAYEPRGLVVAATNRNGFVTRYEYDARQRLVATIDPGGRTNRFEYDEEGVLRATINPLGERSGVRVDAMGYPVAFTNPLGQVTTLTRDNMKRVTRVVDATFHTNRFTYDVRGLLTSAIRDLFAGGSVSATYNYNQLGRLTSIMDPNLSFWQFAYTRMGRMTNFTDPLARNTSFQYDPRGRLIRTAWPNASSATNTYDGTGNLTRRQFSDGTDLQFAYDALDRLTNATGSDPVVLAYDAEGRVTNTISSGLNFGAAYDAGGRLTQVTYRGAPGFAVTYTYDDRDRLIAVSDSLTLTSLTFTYDDAHRLTGVTRPNGVNSIYTYDAAGRVTRIQEGAVLDLRYTWDAAGKLAEADYVAAPIDPTTVTPAGTNTFSYNTAAELTAAGYGHDARGRQTNSPAAALQWDAASRLIGISNVALAYDALGNLLTRAEPAGTNRYYYNHAIALAPIVAERDEATGQFRRFYVWSPGGALLYIINAQTLAVSWPHFDHLGSTLALTDGAGAVTDAYAYSPYGELLAQTGASTQPFRFVGRYGLRHEPAANLVHLRARYYDPKTTRFLSHDPVWPDLRDPKRLNPYSYALNEPTRMVDVAGSEAGAVVPGLLAIAAETRAGAIYQIKNGRLVQVRGDDDDERSREREEATAEIVRRNNQPATQLATSILDQFDTSSRVDGGSAEYSAQRKRLLMQVGLWFAGIGSRLNSGVTGNSGPVSQGASAAIGSGSAASGGNPYPSTIKVSDLLGSVSRVSIRLGGFSPSFPSDTGILFGGDSASLPPAAIQTRTPFTLIIKPGGLVTVVLDKQAGWLGGDEDWKHDPLYFPGRTREDVERDRELTRRSLGRWP